MSDAMKPADVAASGLTPPTREFLDFRDVKFTKEPKKLVDKDYLTPEAAKLQGVVAKDENPTVPMPAVPGEPVLPLPSVSQAAPQAPGLPSLPAANAPALPGGQDLIQARLSKVYGATSGSDRFSELEARFENALQRLEGRITGQAQAAAYQPSAFNAQEPSGEFVSKAELQRILDAQARQLGDAVGLQQSHILSRMEAERDFPDVFQSPAAKEAVDRIWAADRNLRQDANGPYKAAMMARGLAIHGNPLPAGGGASATEVKAMLSGLGSTVAQGNAPAEDRAARYQKALERYRETGKSEDFVRARRIALNIE